MVCLCNVGRFGCQQLVDRNDASPRGWSRRRDQYEMSDEDVHSAIAIAHEGGAKLRVAFNTNMQSHEIAPMLAKMEQEAGSP